MRQCKLRFLDINMHIIEQNIYVLCNKMSCKCHLMKIKGLVINFAECCRGVPAYKIYFNLFNTFWVTT
jgi:hypothetical protein